MAKQELKAHPDGKETRSVITAASFLMASPHRRLEQHVCVVEPLAFHFDACNSVYIHTHVRATADQQCSCYTLHTHSVWTSCESLSLFVHTTKNLRNHFNFACLYNMRPQYFVFFV